MSSIQGLLEYLRSKIIFVIISVSIIIVYSVALLSLDLTVPGAGFSPFNIWTPLQSISFAILGSLLLFISILIDEREREFDLKWLLLLIPLMILSVLIQFSAEPQQLLNHIHWLEGFYFLSASSPYLIVDFASIFFYGGLLGLILTYLNVSDSLIIEDDRITSKAVDFVFKIVIVVIFIPAMLTFVLFFLIAIANAAIPLVFPSYGEGTIGSLLAVSAILSMYFGARILNNWKQLELPSLSMIASMKTMKMLIDVLSIFTCTVAAFSLMGGLITDRIPAPLLIPFDYVILTIYLTLPFSFLLIRDRLFPLKAVSEQKHESASSDSGIPLN